jgi:hypothetical protein
MLIALTALPAPPTAARADRPRLFSEHHLQPPQRRGFLFAAVVSLLGAGTALASDHSSPDSVTGNGRQTAMQRMTTRQIRTSRDSSGVLEGTLTDAADGEPVPCATVILLGTDVAAFAQSDGRFRLTRLHAGTYTLRVRQIGFYQKDTTVEVRASPLVTTVALKMTRFPALLALVRVRWKRTTDCVATGVPDSVVDRGLARARDPVDGAVVGGR